MTYSTHNSLCPYKSDHRLDHLARARTGSPEGHPSKSYSAKPCRSFRFLHSPTERFHYPRIMDETVLARRKRRRQKARVHSSYLNGLEIPIPVEEVLAIQIRNTALGFQLLFQTLSSKPAGGPSI